MTKPSRRTLLAALAAAPIAGVPVLVGTASKNDDPVFQAIAALRQLKIHAEEQEAAYEIAEAAVFRARKENVVTLDGEEMRTHEQINAYFKPTFEDEEQFNRFVEALRPRRLSDAERDRARQAAHDQLALKEAKNAEVEQRVGYREIKEQYKSANSAVWDAEYKVMEVKPTTPAGAVSLLRFVAELIDAEFPLIDEDAHRAMALRNAADFFERSTSA
jgi:hypothetical protein